VQIPGTICFHISFWCQNWHHQNWCVLQSPKKGGMERVEEGDLVKSMQNKKSVWRALQLITTWEELLSSEICQGLFKDDTRQG